MRLFLIALLIFSAKTAFAIPIATTAQCAMWAKLIKEDTEKYRQARSLEQRAFYRDRVYANRERRRAGRCRGR